VKSLPISSVDNPRAKRVAALRKSRDRRESGLLVAEGLREVQRALEAGLELLEWWWTPSLLGDQGPAWQALLAQAGQRWPGALRLDAEPRVLQKLAYREKPEGGLAVLVAPRWTLEQVLSTPAARGDALWLIAVGTEKPGNLGAMVRSASAAGAAGVFVADEVADAFNPNAIRASTGAVFSLPVVESTGPTLRAALAAHGIRLAAAVAQGGTDCTRTDLRGPLAIVIGPEDRGLDDAWLAPIPGAQPLLRLTIPMAHGPVDSLNASVAAAVLLFEAARQRRAGS
jgi:TrmH family RNA methyltransferase